MPDLSAPDDGGPEALIRLLAGRVASTEGRLAELEGSTGSPDGPAGTDPAALERLSGRLSDLEEQTRRRPAPAAGTDVEAGLRTALGRLEELAGRLELLEQRPAAPSGAEALEGRVADLEAWTESLLEWLKGKFASLRNAQDAPATPTGPVPLQES